MRNYIKIPIVIICCLFLLGWLIGSFIEADFLISHWDIAFRKNIGGWIGGLSIVAGTVSFLIEFVNKIPEK